MAPAPRRLGAHEAELGDGRLAPPPRRPGDPAGVVEQGGDLAAAAVGQLGPGPPSAGQVGLSVSNAATACVVSSQLGFAQGGNVALYGEPASQFRQKSSY